MFSLEAGGSCPSPNAACAARFIAGLLLTLCCASGCILYRAKQVSDEHLVEERTPGAVTAVEVSANVTAGNRLDVSVQEVRSVAIVEKRVREITWWRNSNPTAAVIEPLIGKGFLYPVLVWLEPFFIAELGPGAAKTPYLQTLLTTVPGYSSSASVYFDTVYPKGLCFLPFVICLPTNLRDNRFTELDFTEKGSRGRARADGPGADAEGRGVGD